MSSLTVIRNLNKCNVIFRKSIESKSNSELILKFIRNCRQLGLIIYNHRYNIGYNNLNLAI